MIPLRAESSTVSLPPRERALAKRRAKAIKLGLPPSIASKSPAKGIQKRAKPPAPPPTLAATRQRRAAADVAYLDRPDGYHIKRVVRRVSPGPAPPVPYLPGEEDIPRSDTESEDSDAQVPELAALSTNSRVAVETEDTPTEPDSDLVDYDAEGEDEDGDGDTYMQHLPPANHSFSMGPECAGASGSMPGVEATSATNPFASASQDDIQALFGSLGNPHFGDGHPTNSNGDHFPGFPDVYSPPVPDCLVAHTCNLFGDGAQYGIQDSNTWEPFTVHQLNATVNDLQARQPSLASAESCSNHPARLSPPDNLPHRRPPPSRVATPAPWIIVPETQAPNLRQPTTPLPQRYALASQTGTPTGLPFSLRPLTSPHPRPHLSTRELVSQARSQAQSSRPSVPPLPTNLPNINNLRTRSSPDIDDALPFGLGSLRLSLDLDDVGNNTDDAIAEDEERLLDPDASRPSTPVMLKETDVGLNESSTIQITQARCRASRFLNARRPVPHRAASSPRRIPTVLELKTNARRLYKLHHRKHRRRHHAPAPETSRRRKRGVLRAGALTPEQQMVMGPTEYHLFKDIICENPWPEDREVFLQAAENYATNITGISGADVFTESFLDTIFYKMSANRGNSLTRIEVMVEQG
ncbi:hypothetical protein FRC10_005254, partial [Ceratobasidium sp. 414]